MTLLLDNAWFMMQGLWFTLRLAVATLLLAGVVAIAVGLMSVSRLRLLRVLALCYVEFWRDIPLLVNVLFVYFGAPNPTASAAMLRGFDSAGIAVRDISRFHPPTSAVRGSSR